MIAEDDFNLSNTLDPAELDWFYTSIRLTSGDEIFALSAVEKDKKTIVLKHPIKVSCVKTEDNNYTLKWSRYNPFSDDEYTRFRVDQIHTMNFLSDKFRANYKQILKDDFGEEDEDPALEEGLEASTEAEIPGGEQEIPGEEPATMPETQDDGPADFLPVASANVRSSTNKKLH